LARENSLVLPPIENKIEVKRFKWWIDDGKIWILTFSRRIRED
jgi:hypothetical protein